MAKGVNRNQRIRQLQDQILAKTERRTGPLPEAMVRAFREYPRHTFVARFRLRVGAPWIEVNSSNLDAHLEALYSDQPLAIWGETETLSTISQPSFVLMLLKLLDLHPGDRVFELGAGSGWNAALMGALCAPGSVYSYEIIPELAVAAQERLARSGLNHVHIVAGDGMDFPEGHSFNRGIFTAGASDLPRCLYRALENDSRLLFVLKQDRRTDLLMVLKKVGDEFHSERIFECGFVPVTGPHGSTDDPVALEIAKILKEAKSVRIFSSDRKVKAGKDQILISRRQSQFLWTF